MQFDKRITNEIAKKIWARDSQQSEQSEDIEGASEEIDVVKMVEPRISLGKIGGSVINGVQKIFRMNSAEN